jgi:hypothetical protein
MDAPRVVHSATLLNTGNVLITGGWNGASDQANGLLYNPSTGAFTSTGSLNTPRDCHTAILLDNGTVLISGGETSIGTPLASAELYNPATGTYTVTGSLSTERYQGSAVLLTNGTVLVAGGGNVAWNYPLTSADLYETSTLTPPGLVSISVTPLNFSVPVGVNQQFVATGTFSDNSHQTLEAVTWTSSATSVATISNDPDNPGEAQGVAAGSSTIKACAGAVCGSTTLTVTLNNGAPAITGLWPDQGAPQTQLIIEGAGFGASQGTSTVTVGGVMATVLPDDWSATSITAQVPTLLPGTVPVVVTVNGVASNSSNFVVTTGFTCQH